MAREAHMEVNMQREGIPLSNNHDEKQQDVATADDGQVTAYPSKAKLTLITIALCLSVFLMALDNSIIATAIPKITDEFSSITDVGWYGSAYLLTTAALQLQFGKFYTYLSIKWTYLTAIAIFELGSLLCGVARSSTMLIVGRAIAGLGAAGIYSGALIILANSVPLDKRPAYIGLISSMYGISSVVGPLLGGAFADKVTWRWCFYIRNVLIVSSSCADLPIGAITVAIIAFFFPQPVQHKPPPEPLVRRIRRFDPLGTLFLIPAVICILLALQWGGIEYPWSNGRIIALLVLGALLLIGFVLVQIWQKEDATVPPRIFDSRTVWASSLYAFGLGASFFIGVYYIPIWFQAVKNTTAVGSGIRNLPMMLSAVIFSIVAGVAVTAHGHYAPFFYLGTICMSVGGGLLTRWVPESSASVWIGYQILFGVGVGFALQQPMVAVQTVLDIKDVPVGASLIVFIQSIGGAMFVAVGQTVLTNELVKQLAVNAPSVHAETLLATGATRLENAFSGDALTAVILSYNGALSRVFIVCAAMAAFTIIGCVFVEWKSVKGKEIDMSMGG